MGKKDNVESVLHHHHHLHAPKIETVEILGIDAATRSQDNAPLILQNAPKCHPYRHHQHASKIVTVEIVGITSHAATRDNAQLTMENVHRDRDATKIVTVEDITSAA